MADKIKFVTPPTWNVQTTSYQDYKFEVELWARFTKLEKDQKGFAVYSSLPHERDIHDKIRLAIQNKEIKIEEDNAITQIFNVLDPIFKEDDLTSVYETWKRFKNFDKKDEESMESYINEYDRRVKELKKNGIELPEVVLAMQILDGAKLDQKEKQIVLTAVDYNEKTKLFDQMKSALRKFLGSQCFSQTQIKVKQEAFKIEDEEIEEAYISRGRYNFRGRRPNYRGNGTSRGGYRSNDFSQGNSLRGGRDNEFKPANSRGSYGRGYYYNQRGKGSTGTKNAKDEFGNHKQCGHCQSIMHYFRDCPHRHEAFETSCADVYKIEYSQEDKQILMTETIHAAILDSACSKTVAGRSWKEMYLASLPRQEKEKVIMYPSETTFKFGSGDTISSNQIMEIPCSIGGLHTTIKTEVVDTDIPLLLSKPDMKRLGFKINLANDTLEINGRNIELDTTSSGHYFIPLKDCEMQIETVHVINEIENKSEKITMIKKLHRQFGHPSTKSLKAILKNAEVLDKHTERIVEEIGAKCDICSRYKRTPSTPVVSLPLAKQFNDVVAMDLKTFGDVYFLHFIDLYTRFSKAKVIKRKLPQTIIDSVATEWLASGFGPPKKFLVDNGGEFDNEHYRELGEHFNIEVSATAAYSPWSNGICERNHYVIDVCVQKMLEEDPGLSLDVALAWAVNAKNTMQNHLGFSPIQLVVGNNPNLPNVITNKLPAQEEGPMSIAVARHLNALHAARKAFTKAESSERIKRALRHNVRVKEIPFFQGESVFYKRDDNNRWRGPGRVIGQDGKVLFIRHGSQLIRVSTCRAIKVDSSQSGRDKERNDEIQINDEYVKNNETSINNNERNDEIEINNEYLSELETESAGTAVQEPQRDEAQEVINTHLNHYERLDESVRIPKPQENIRYKLSDEDEWIYAKVLSRGGKSSGKNRFYMNIVNENTDDIFGIHLNQVQYEIIENQGTNTDSHSTQNEDVNVTSIPYSEHNNLEVKQAKEKELENWKSFNVYTEVSDLGQKTISTRWVVTKKDICNQECVKARLVVRGFEEENQIQSDSPTASKSTLRMVMAIASSNNWKIETIDIKAAFLQGKDLDRDVFVLPPKEVREDGVIWKLNKAAYGLGDASRNWYFGMRDDLLGLGCVQSELDKALFRQSKNGKLEGIFLMHVDDFLFAGSEDFNQSVIAPISEKYKVGKRLQQHFKYVGLNVIQNANNTITIDQNQYASEIGTIHIEASRKSDTDSPLNQQETNKLKSVAGQLNWLATQTRPDLSYSALELNMSKKHPKIDNLVNANKAIRQAKNNNSQVHFPNLGDCREWKLKVFCDASWGNLPDGASSTQGHVIFLTGKDGNSCPIAWTSNKVKRKVSSSLAAETLSLHDSLDEAIYLNSLICETCFDNKYLTTNIPIVAHTDNRSLHENLHSTKQVHEKRLRVNIAEIRRLLAEKEVKTVVWIQGSNQIADILTKRGANPCVILEIFKKAHIDV